MKKIFKLILILLLLSFLSGCDNTITIMNYNSDSFIDLYNYNSISVDYEYIQITQEDIKNIIETELSVKEAYIEIPDKQKPNVDDIALISIDNGLEYYFIGSERYSEDFDKELLQMCVGETKQVNLFEDNLSAVKLISIYRLATIEDTDFILKYYNRSDINELNSFIKERASKEITFNYSYEIICENSSIIKIPNEIQTQINSDIKSYYKEILEYYSNIEEFFDEENITKEEFEESIATNYYEMMIFKAIMDNENITITQKEIDDYRNENGMNEYSDYDIYRELAYSLVREILMKRTQIINE
ncbi:MAG: hypothetical protein IJW86_09565 [Clostridia bacterium]|nr:hypothetical protein [Clostridia bacterium]